MDFSQLFDIGTSAILLWLFVRQEERLIKLTDYIQSILTEQLASNERDRIAERQRRKLGRAVGADLDSDTEGIRPKGLDDEISRLKNEENGE